MNRFEFIVGIETLMPQHIIDELEEAGPDEPIPLAHAPYLPEIFQVWSEKTLRNAISRGDLRGEMIGRKIFVTRRAIAEWRDRATVRPKDRITVPESARADPKAAASRAAAMSALAALKVKR